MKASPDLPLGAPSPIVYIVDDDHSLRTAVSRLLRAAGFTVRDFACGPEFLAAARDDVPSCLLMDVRMPGPSGLDLQRSLNAEEESPPIVFLTGHGDVAMGVHAMKAGAVDFLTKPVRREPLLKAVRDALARDEERRTSRERRRKLNARYETLTPREREVLVHVVAGRLNKQIAADLGTSERTVKAHRAQVMSKMRVGSLADLVRAAQQLGLGESSPQ
jgi:RNA polymerase sigma factor (sigma-70 family)